MGLLDKLFGRRPTARQMTLESEGRPPIVNPTEIQVRDLVLGLVRTGPSFASLTDELGNYVQAAGSRPWCVVERRCSMPLFHDRAFQVTPNPKYADGVKISTGAGEIELQHDEWFLLKDAADIFVSFLNRSSYPTQVEWRSLNDMFGIE